MTSFDTATAEPASRTPSEIPGDLAMWCFILAELTAFALLFVSLAAARVLHADEFHAGAATLHPAMGLINTLVLLTGSYLVAHGIAQAKRLGVRACNRWFLAGAGTGLIYIVVKVAEYAQLGLAGYTLRSSTFHFFYFFTTFFHLMHVVLGMVILIAVGRRCRAGSYAPADLRAPESAASYWHMVDLVWLVLFPAVYILR